MAVVGLGETWPGGRTRDEPISDFNADADMPIFFKKFADADTDMPIFDNVLYTLPSKYSNK